MASAFVAKLIPELSESCSEMRISEDDMLPNNPITEETYLD